jgi:hypothetical protein
LKPERWGSLLVQEKYQEEKACAKRHPYRIIIIMGKDVEGSSLGVISVTNVPFPWGN